MAKALHINRPVCVQTVILHIYSEECVWAVRLGRYIPSNSIHTSRMLVSTSRSYSEPLKKRIVNCTECVLGMTYPPRLRERNLALQEEYTPRERIKLVILGESPPIKGGYIYDRQTQCNLRTYSYQVLVDLRYFDKGMRSISEDDKAMMLDRMKYQSHALALDCCNCAVNHLRGPSQDVERDKLVADCFSKYAEKALERICKEYDPQIWFKLPPRRGDGLWKEMKAKYGARIIRKEYWSTPESDS